MTFRKLRLLWVSEFSGLNTGFSVYSYEVLKRLHATGKYEIAELAAYGDRDHPKMAETPWRVFPTTPKTPAEEAEFRRDPCNQFGKWKFEEACLSHRPDVVVDIRDVWMASFIDEGVYRDFFKWYYMPTVDAIPQKDNWLQVMACADKVFSYTEWGLDVIKSQSHGQINTVAAAPPGADSVFRPLDKAKVREALKLPNANIIGFLSRNQSRKLIPDLIDSFAGFVNKCVGTDLDETGRNTYLLLHTSYPDVGFDLPDLIKNSGVGEKILLTYNCGACEHFGPRHYSDAITICPRCKNKAYKLTSTGDGVSRESLSLLLNSLDCYMQYSNSEGFGMGAVEAAACGVPVFATDYSAMADVVRRTGGFPIRVKATVKEAETGCERAKPDQEHTIELWQKFFQLSKAERTQLSHNAVVGATLCYNYDKTAKIWEAALDEEKPRDWSETWERPAFDLMKPNLSIPDIKDPLEFISWCEKNVVGRPLRPHIKLKLAKYLGCGFYLEGKSMAALMTEDSTLASRLQNGAKFGREECLALFLEMREKTNKWESSRAAGLQKVVA